MDYLNEEWEDELVLEFVRAYSEGYLRAGGDNLPDAQAAVVTRLAEFEVTDASRARALGREDAHDELERGPSDDPDAP